ncbi:MAG: insulinase family protein [Clostridiales bacterium]|nr:insulinase family protein [Clostridiales bacterium]
MTKVNEIRNERLNDGYFEIEHSSGLKIYVYPKQNFTSTYAIFGTKYGSIDNRFRIAGTEAVTQVPEGIAHFLEHKLFESEELDAFARYAETGASANAYTTFDRTCYLFSCSDNFEQSLEILLDFVSNPYFTAETVQKEQGIIGQEIKMTNDEPGWALFFSLLKAMYVNHPVRIDIAGTVESIAEITPELLYECYNTFYNPANMALAVAGNASPEQVIKVADKVLKPVEEKTIERVFDEEPSEVNSNYAERRLEVAKPLFAIGYKEKQGKEKRGLRQEIESNIMMEIIAGDTSPLYEKLMDMGYVNTNFDAEYFCGPGYGAHIFSGESDNYEEIRKMLNSEIGRLKAEGVDRDDFERIKRNYLGQLIMSFNSISTIANGFIRAHFEGYGFFDELSILDDITVEDIDRRIRDTLNESNSSMSVVKPEQERKI